jgi:hypothetical protein
MTEALEGGCACGRVRYRISGAPRFSFHCQCRKCQRATAGGHSSAVVADGKSVKLSGELKFFEQQADSGYLTRAGCCPNCGSPVLNLTARFPESRYIHAATLDDPASFRPERVVFRAEAQPWDHVDPDLP